MLPYFAASGHNLYLKSAYLYLQSMLELEQNHPDVHAAFLNGHYAIRRSDRYWGRLSSDLIIEQVLMKSLKSAGGLTRGRGMTEQQRTLWLFSMPICVSFNNAMQDFTKTQYETSEQHKEVGKSRVKKDKKDISTMYSFLKLRNPFISDDNILKNIDTGVTATSDVNVEQAKVIGEGILSSMTDQEVEKYTFKRSFQVVTLSDNSAVKITGEPIQIDTQLLFQRLLAASQRYNEDLSDIFQYELCSFPSSLFDNTGFLREAQKSTLADAIWKQGDCRPNLQDYVHSNTCFVLDGGSLIQKLSWENGSTFGQICDQYINYVSSRYNNVTVVFDGYCSGPSTKDVTHFRRSKGKKGTVVKFSSDTPFRSKKEFFMHNNENKQSFIFLLGNV